MILRYILNQIKLIILRYKISRKTDLIFLFGTPAHSNMGDQAQTYCILEWLKENYGNYKVILFTLNNASDPIIRFIRKRIKPNDMLVCHSGYHLTDLYHEKDVYFQVIALFPEYRILMFPQTIHFVKDKEDEQRVTQIFNQHKNIVLMCRDETSYVKAQTLFKSCHLLLYPDIVTSLIGRYHYDNIRDGVLFCMRNDKEAFYKPEQIQQLRQSLAGLKTDITDTTITLSWRRISRNRKIILENMFCRFSKYKLVITDRYHGTIFSLIAGTPVIVLTSTDHKLSSGVKWFPKEFEKYVYFASDLEQAYTIAMRLVNDTGLEYCLPSYFLENYYLVLKSRLELLK